MMLTVGIKGFPQIGLILGEESELLGFPVEVLLWMQLGFVCDWGY